MGGRGGGGCLVCGHSARLTNIPPPPHRRRRSMHDFFSKMVGRDHGMTRAQFAKNMQCVPVHA